MFSIVLDVFEGPLDLLLHLTKKHELDIFDIPIHFITERFLEVLEHMERLDLDVGGEFLVMAATLTEIKSRMLLPKPPAADDLEDEPADPRQQLVQQLIEYQKYKDLAGRLDERDRLGRDVFTRPGRRPDGRATLPFGRLDMVELLAAFVQVDRRLGFQKRMRFTVERRSIEDEMHRICQALGKRRMLPFMAIVERDEAGAPDRSSLIGCFLAILELSRRRLIDVFHDTDRENVLTIRAAVKELSLVEPSDEA